MRLGTIARMVERRHDLGIGTCLVELSWIVWPVRLVQQISAAYPVIEARHSPVRGRLRLGPDPCDDTDQVNTIVPSDARRVLGGGQLGNVELSWRSII